VAGSLTAAVLVVGLADADADAEAFADADAEALDDEPLNTVSGRVTPSATTTAMASEITVHLRTWRWRSTLFSR
jgi:hypothetical protein